MNKLSGADSFSAEQKHAKRNKRKTAFSVKKMAEEAVFWVEILANFKFYACFLGVISAFDVLLYAYHAEITPSASK